MYNSNKYKFICFWLSILMLGALFSSCQGLTGQVAADRADESGLLAHWLESTGNYINSAQVPAIMTAAETHNLLDSNILIIDLRNPVQFAGGHIEGAVNIEPSAVLDYFDNNIDATSFDRIIFTCSMGQLSAYVTGLMRLAGYDNTYSIRYGLSAWNRQMAASGWDLVPGNTLEKKLIKKSSPKFTTGNLPQIHTGHKQGYRIARARISDLLGQPKQRFLIAYDTLMDDLSKYYIINYWPEEQYLLYGHLPGAVQYDPKKSLGLNTGLLTLPTDRPVVIYCNNGHHSAHVTAFLRLLGYDAYSLQYGANAFMADMMKKYEKKPHTYWNETNSLDYPIVTSGAQQDNNEPAPTGIKTLVGGC